MDSVIAILGLFGRRATLVVLTLLAIYICTKYFQRWLFLRTLRIDRVSAHEVRTMLDIGEPVTIIDLRHPADIERECIKISGAIVASREDLRSLSRQIPEISRPFFIALDRTKPLVPVWRLN